MTQTHLPPALSCAAADSRTFSDFNQDFTPLIRAERQDAAVYLYLSRQLADREARILRCLYDQEQAHAACLEGISALHTGKSVPFRPELPEQQSPAEILRSCYGRTMHRLAAYEANSTHPECGAVFRRLALQEKEHCRLLLALLRIVGKQ